MTADNPRELIANIDQARAAYIDDAFSTLLDVVGAMGAADDAKASELLARGRERLDQGRRMKYKDTDYVEKVLPDLMLAYQFIGGRSAEAWEVIRHLIWQERHAAAFNEFTYLLEMDLWDLVGT
jgi:hypothetical protein